MFKQKYRKLILNHLVARLSENDTQQQLIKKVSVYQAIIWIHNSWKDVTETTISNCFKKAEFKQNSEDMMEVQEEYENVSAFENKFHSFQE